jgi:hypothetical protein
MPLKPDPLEGEPPSPLPMLPLIAVLLFYLLFKVPNGRPAVHAHWARLTLKRSVGTSFRFRAIGYGSISGTRRWKRRTVSRHLATVLLAA